MSDNLITTDDLNGIEKAKLMEIINDIKTGNILTMSISISWNIYPRHTTSIGNKNPCVYKVTHANCGIFYSILNGWKYSKYRLSCYRCKVLR